MRGRAPGRPLRVCFGSVRSGRLLLNWRLFHGRLHQARRELVGGLWGRWFASDGMTWARDLLLVVVQRLLLLRCRRRVANGDATGGGRVVNINTRASRQIRRTGNSSTGRRIPGLGDPVIRKRIQPRLVAHLASTTVVWRFTMPRARREMLIARKGSIITWWHPLSLQSAQQNRRGYVE